jgi:LemA protein
MAIGILLLIVTAFVFIFVFNLFARKKNQVYNVSASLDALLKKRYDLIPNLVEVVKGYAAFEQQALENIVRLRGEGIQASDIGEKGAVSAKTTQGITQILALAEKYPLLKADGQFRFLQASLNEMEEQISAGRRAYNASVMDINTALAIFPLNLFGRLYRVKPFPFFSIADEERRTPSV